MQPIKFNEKKINVETISSELQSPFQSTQTELKLKQHPSSELKYTSHPLMMEYRISDSDQKEFSMAYEEMPSASVEQLYQQAINFLYSHDYIDAFTVFNQLTSNKKAQYVQVNWESCLFKIQILSILRRFDEALLQAAELQKAMKVISHSAKEMFNIQLAVYQALLLICINKANDADKIQKDIKDKVPVHFSHLIRFFIDTDTKQTEAKLLEKIKQAQFVEQWVAAVQDGSMECTILNSLYLWLGLILATKEQYSLSEFYFKKIIPTVYQFDGKEYRIYPLDEIDVSYEAHLQLLLNKIKKNESKEFINMIEKEKAYINRKEIVFLKLHWLTQGIIDINEYNLTQYAGLTSESLKFIKQSYHATIITKFYHQLMAKLEALFAHFYIHQYNNEFKGYDSLDQCIHEKHADCLFFFGDLDSTANQYGHATTTKILDTSDKDIAARAHFKRYALSYIKTLPQLNRDSIKKILFSFEDKSYFECVLFIDLMSQTGMQLAQFDKNQNKVPKGHEAICLQWLGIILFHKQQYDEAINYFNRLIEKFSKIKDIVLLQLYKARAHARLGEKSEFYDIFSYLIKSQREAYGLKHHDLDLIQIECEGYLANKIADRKDLINVYNKLIKLRQVLKDEYAIYQYQYLDTLQNGIKQSIVIHYFNQISSSLKTLIQQKPTTFLSFKKSKHVDFDKKWETIIQFFIQQHFMELMQYDDSINSLDAKLYSIYEAANECNDLVKSQIEQLFSKFLKQQSDAKKIVADPITSGLSKKDLFKVILSRELEQGFFNALSYKHGFVPNTSFDVADKVRLLATAATLLPLGETFSKSCVGLSLFVGISKDIYNALKTEQAQTMSSRILDLLPPGYRGRDISDFSDIVGLAVGDIYSKQIEKLTIALPGIPLFAKQAATIMLWYIATDEGRRSALFNIAAEAREYGITIIASLLRMNVTKEAERNTVSKMVVGLFFTPLARKTNERLLLATDDKTVNETNPWTGEGVIRRTAIEKNNQVYLLPGITQFKKYGSIKVPDTMTEEWLKKQGYQQVAKEHTDSVDEFSDKDSVCFVM